MSVQFPMVTHSMLRVSWVPGANDVPGHRITYSTNHGSDVKQVNFPNKLPNYKKSVSKSTPTTEIMSLFLKRGIVI